MDIRTESEGMICSRDFFGNFVSVISGINAKTFFQNRDRLRYWPSIGEFSLCLWRSEKGEGYASPIIYFSLQILMSVARIA